MKVETKNAGNTIQIIIIIKELLSDNEGNFCNGEVKRIVQNEGVIHRFTLGCLQNKMIVVRERETCYDRNSNMRQQNLIEKETSKDCTSKQ